MCSVTENSKTYQYRKVMKPMLERKRRARINKCLDELKDLMIATLESEGEHVTRLEKADILELTVQHLQKLREKRLLKEKYQYPALSQAEGFRSGFIFAANEVSRNLAQIPGVNVTFGTQLMTHLGKRLNQIQPPLKAPIPIHHQISIQCNAFSGIPTASNSSSSIASMSPVSSNEDNYSPIGNYSENILLKHPLKNSSSLLQRYDFNEEENVWRPW